MSAIMFDLDGVIYESDSAIAGAAETIDWFKKNQIPHLYLTNTTSRSREELVAKLKRFDIDTDEDAFFTPPLAARQLLLTRGLKTLALFTPETTKDEFAEFDVLTETEAEYQATEIDAVILGDLGTEWTFGTLNRIFRMLIANPDMLFIALGMTRYWKTQSGLQLDVGPMVKALEYATGKTATVTGKPSTEFFQAAIELLGNDQDIIMIGDDIHGDIEASRKAGLKAILVRTGKFTEADLDLGIEPDAIIDSIRYLPAWWRENLDTETTDAG